MVAAVGDGVTEVAVGDRVAWVGSGQLRPHVVGAAGMFMPVPASMDLDVAATVPLQGMTRTISFRTPIHFTPGNAA